MKTPLNIRQLFGHRYRIVLDESVLCEPGGKDDPCYFQVPCKFGHFYPHSDKFLAFYCSGGIVRGRLHREQPQIEVQQWSDVGEAVFLFPLDQFDLISVYAKPKRKRRLSGEHYRKLVKACHDHRFSSENHGTQTPKTTLSARFSANATKERRPGRDRRLEMAQLNRSRDAETPEP